MYIQDQLPHDRITDDNLSYYKAIGVDYLTVNSPPPRPAHLSRDGRVPKGGPCPHRKKRPPLLQTPP